jgi:hypothetical protein
VAAGSLEARQAQQCLPPDLTSQLPDCSFDCILTFAHLNFAQPTCAFTSEIEHICSTKTSSGTTIGEASLQCVASNCGNLATNNILLTAYNICEDVDDAIPNTATVINATIDPSPSRASASSEKALIATQDLATTTAPPPPAETGIIANGGGSMVVSGDGTTVTMEIVMSATSTAPTAAATMTDMGSNFMQDQMPQMNTGLSEAQVAGIATGTAVAALLLIGAVFFLLRRRRKEKKEDAAWTKKISSPDTETSQATSFGFARPEVPKVNKHLSFWRMSPGPDEIGVAVTQKPSQHPQSPSVRKSLLQRAAPAMPWRLTRQRTSWPSPWSDTAKILSPPPRPPRDSVATTFDEDIEQLPDQPPRVSIGGVRFALAEPPSSVPKVPPQALQLDQIRTVSPTLTSAGSRSNVTIPLTPKYDNGNFATTVATRAAAPASIDATLAESSATFGRIPGPASPQRNRLQKKAPVRPPHGAPLIRENSDTTFETDSTAESLERRLSRPQTALPTILQSPRTATAVRYPAVPQSSALSPKTGYIPQPLRILKSPPPTTAAAAAPPRPTRDSLIRNEASFITTDSTSTAEGRLSDFSIDWPVPPSGRPSVAPLSGAQAQAQAQAPVSNAGLRVTSQPPSPLSRPSSFATNRNRRQTDASVYSQPSPVSVLFDTEIPVPNKAKITPTKANSGGDLFFTVEMP